MHCQYISEKYLPVSKGAFQKQYSNSMTLSLRVVQLNSTERSLEEILFQGIKGDDN